MTKVVKKTLSMKELIAKNAKPQPLMASVPVKLRAKMRADLVTILRAKHAGQKTPGIRKIAVFFQTTYQYHASPSTVRDWLQKLDEELYGMQA